MIQAILDRLAPWLRLWPLVLAIIAFGGGWEVNGWRWEAKHASELQEQIDAREAQERVAQKASTALEGKIAAIQTTNRELNRRLANETINPAYSCRVPDSGLRILQDAIAGNAAREPDGSLPRTDTPAK